jgi:chaperonin GroES
MTIGIRPFSSSIANRVIVKRKDPEKQSRGGIWIPDMAQNQPFEGTVVAVGGGRWLPNGERLPPAVKVGDRVLFGKYSGMDVKVHGDEHLFLIEQEIDAVLED